jgi:hypothetical protein
MIFVIGEPDESSSRRLATTPIGADVLGPAPKPPVEPMAAGMKRASWAGSNLVVERGGTISGQTVSLKQQFTIDTERGELIVERLVIVQHGYTQRGAQNYSTVKDVFARSPR